MDEEFNAREELREKCKKIKTFDDLVAFLKEVEENYNAGYGTAPRAIAQAALAVGWYLSSKFGITGFQASFVMWDFVRDWSKSDNKTGLKLVDYDEMLYPQYDYKFEKTISKSTWKELQKTAKEKLDNADKYVHPSVKAHWENIVNGIIPFGYMVTED